MVVCPQYCYILALPPGGVGLLKLMSDWGRMQWLNRLRAYNLFATGASCKSGDNFLNAPEAYVISCDFCHGLKMHISSS